MDDKSDVKRLFFAFEVFAPWAESYPKGRIIAPECRHVTIAFLGNLDPEPLMKTLDTFPRPLSQIGASGFFDGCLLLPLRHPHVIAWHMTFFESLRSIQTFIDTVFEWLTEHQISFDRKGSWLPHMTIARYPFNKKEWVKTFKKLPMFFKAIHLYESLPGLTYRPIWTKPLLPPFEEIEHTADLAFHVRGNTFQELAYHAMCALAFKFPPILEEPLDLNLQNQDEIVQQLNQLICKLDTSIGCPFKAVSYHGDAFQDKMGLLNWEMIIDV